MGRTMTRAVFIGAVIVLAFLIGFVVNWFKLSPTDPISEVDKNVYLRNVDSTFVTNYGINYESNYVYFIRGDVETKVYRGDTFLTNRVETDTINVVLDKKITKETLKPNH